MSYTTPQFNLKYDILARVLVFWTSHWDQRKRFMLQDVALKETRGHLWLVARPGANSGCTKTLFPSDRVQSSFSAARDLSKIENVTLSYAWHLIVVGLTAPLSRSPALQYIQIRTIRTIRKKNWCQSYLQQQQGSYFTPWLRACTEPTWMQQNFPLSANWIQLQNTIEGRQRLFI